MCHVDEDRRFSVPSELFSALQDDKGKIPDDVWAVIVGLHVQLLGNENVLVRVRDRFAEISGDTRWEAGAEKRTEILRQIDALLPLNCRRHGKKIRCTLSSDFVTAGLFTPPQDIVVVVVGEIIQLWPVAAWRDRAAIADLKTFAERLSDITGIEE